MQREIIETENELKNLEEQAEQSATALQKISATALTGSLGGQFSKVEEVEAELADLQKELLKKTNARQAYDDIADKIEELRRKKQALFFRRCQ